MKPHLCRTFLTIFLCLSFLLVPAFAGQAQSIPDDQVKARLDYIQKSLAGGQPHARTWFYGWMGGYTAASAGMLIYAFANWSDVKTVSGKHLPQDAFVGGIATIVGGATVALNPFVPAFALGRLNQLPDGTPEERLAKLQRAEDLLQRAARREKYTRSVMNHVVKLGINAAGSATGALVYKRKWTDALLGFGISSCVSLIHIYSQPTRAIHDWESYEATYLTGGAAAPLPPPEPSKVEWTLSGFPGGFRLNISW